jgi:ATPase subunit of ABC transporter with duplicated ATPase domains
VGLARQKKAQDLKKEKLQEFVSREGKKFDNNNHQMQRKSKLKKLHALKGEQLEDFEEDAEVHLSLPAPYGVFGDSETLLSTASVCYHLPGAPPGSFLFSGVDFVVTPRHRLGIIGKNGCGKTCLLNVLMGELLPSGGEVKRHLGARMTMLQQHHYRGEQLDPDVNAIEHIRLLPQDAGSAVGVQNAGSRQEDTAYRGYLANCGIAGATALLPVKYLSGGQRMRVALAVAMYSRPDLLILDEVSFVRESRRVEESGGALLVSLAHTYKHIHSFHALTVNPLCRPPQPTNHLDAESVKALGESLEQFEVSHMREVTLRAAR